MRGWIVSGIGTIFACCSLQGAITTLFLGPPQVAACGDVSFPGGVVLSDPPLEVNRITFNWGDGTTSDMYFPGEYIYSQNGTYTVTVTATTFAGESRSTTSALTIADIGSSSCAGKLQITSRSLLASTQGVPYDFQLTATGGVAPYQFTLTAFLGNPSQLPVGLVLSVSGAISGASLVSGLFGFAFQVTDSRGNSASRAYGIFEDVPLGVELSQSGLLFRTQTGLGTSLSQPLLAIDLNQQTVSFQTTVNTASGGDWLTVSPPQGTVNQQNHSVPLTVSANPAGLSQGDYYGTVTVVPAGAANATQTASIVLSIQSPQTPPAPSVAPNGLIFVVPQGGANPAAKQFSVTNASTQGLTVQATPGTSAKLTVTPSSASIPSGQSAPFSVQINATGLAPGVAIGTVTLSFTPQAPAQIVDVAVIIVPVPSSQATDSLQARAATGCAPKSLVPVFTLLGANFDAPVAWPTPIEVAVFDDCGTSVANGKVVAAFSNGDSPLSLISEQNGEWSGTWAPQDPRTASTQVTANATSADGQLKGSVSVGGSVPDNPNVPLIAAGGVVDSASYQANPVPSPDEIVSVFGLNLAANTESASALPLPTVLQNSSLVIGGELVPLVFVSQQQVNAVLPADLMPGVRYQMIVENGTQISVPQPVMIAPAEPGIYTTNSTGQGQGHIYVIPQPGLQILAGPNNPARAGDVLTLYCTGMGLVTPPSIAGVPAPFDQLETVTALVQLQIGGQAAQLLFAGLTPGFTGLYQVNAVMPSGVAPGDSVPVTLNVGGVSSSVVTMSAR